MNGGLVALLALLVTLLAGCGYSLSHRLREPFTQARGIYVPVFTNATEETGAEQIFTNAFIRELQSRGEVVMTSREAGGAELVGTIESITYAPTAFTAQGFEGLSPFRRLPLEIGVTAVVSLKLLEPKTARVLWSGSFSSFRRIEAPVDRTRDYQAPSTIGLRTQSLIQSRYVDIARDISRDAYDGMVELF